MRYIYHFLILWMAVIFVAICTHQVRAVYSYDGTDIAMAILHDPSTLISSHYEDTDPTGEFRQRKILSSLGILSPTDGDTFVILSTGIAGATPATTNSEDPGSEIGTYFGSPTPSPGETTDYAKLILNLSVPPGMHNVSIDLQFFSGEYPDYVGTIYNDKVNITVISPSKGTRYYQFDVNSGDFVLKSRDIPGTGFDMFAVRYTGGGWTPTSPDGINYETTTPYWSDDAGASALITRVFPVSPNENITIIIRIQDTGDNLVDSAVFIDNIRFSGYGYPEIKALKTYQDVNGGSVQPGDTIKYTITLSNIGNVSHPNNPGYEFEDTIPQNTSFVYGSLYSSSGSCSYLSSENKIVWDGELPAESSVLITYEVTVSSSLTETTAISNQGVVYWDKDEDGINEEIELTDDPNVDDGIDSDGDGDTWDDDPTVFLVIMSDNITLHEYFSDDAPYSRAIQSFNNITWLSTSYLDGKGFFGVAGGYYYSTSNSFKVQIRSYSGSQYWNYSFNPISSEMNLTSWEIYFACGNNSEASDLILSFRSSSGNEILRLKIDFESVSPENITDSYAPCLYYLNKLGEWVKISTDYPGGFLYNGWYRLVISKNGTKVEYALYRKGVMTDSKIDDYLNADLSSLSRIVWYSTKNPVVCPIFFFDEHAIVFS